MIINKSLYETERNDLHMSELTVCTNPDILNDSQISFEERARQLNKNKELEEKQREHERKSPYQDFAQLNRQNVIHLIKAAQVNPTALSVLLFFIEHMNKMNAIICSYKVLEEQLEMSKATITRSIKYLKDTGFIHIYKSGTSNVYVVNNDLVWTNSGDKVKYCQFPASVILSASEQEEIDKDRKLKFDYTKIAKEN